MQARSATEVFGYRIAAKADEMGIFDALAFKGGTRVKSPGREKQSGRSWASQDLPPRRSYQWPTVALEVAFSESRERVKQDVRMMLRQPRHGEADFIFSRADLSSGK
ncbi:predicted protein [Histoplasma capsulatum G186AR]|uniref:Uncharacterized protein n=1 Tax=Ajellomyces capsulatus (strain G186AR / H82 / ATCC MYA-2454 / RMSCC 2432) TaxID=447093 RepID=C0NAW0_AJECG|nr:uncharacterized protein HCBG_00256 [Histoplasma capsulatum G186AR]EEH10801.1 predicted protein [Histoplasma capsulatum G186AR]